MARNQKIWVFQKPWSLRWCCANLTTQPSFTASVLIKMNSNAYYLAKILSGLQKCFYSTYKPIFKTSHLTVLVTFFTFTTGFSSLIIKALWDIFCIIIEYFELGGTLNIIYFQPPLSWAGAPSSRRWNVRNI